MINERNTAAIRMRAAGTTYKDIAKALGGITMEATRQIVFRTAWSIAGEPTHPLREAAIALIKQRDPDYSPSETDGLSKRAAAVVEYFGDLQSVAAAGKTAVLKRKYSGRKTLNELTGRLKSYGMEWRDLQQNTFDSIGSNRPA